MKIEIEIPDKYAERHIFIFAGMEPVAKLLFGDPCWKIKTSNCSMCGKCCSNLKEGHPFKVINGICEHLKESGGEIGCGLLSARPFSCSVGEVGSKDCTVTWQKYNK